MLGAAPKNIAGTKMKSGKNCFIEFAVAKTWRLTEPAFSVGSCLARSGVGILLNSTYP